MPTITNHLGVAIFVAAIATGIVALLVLGWLERRDRRQP